MSEGVRPFGRDNPQAYLEDHPRILVVTPIYKLFSPFGKGTTPVGGLTNYGYQPLTKWDDPPSTP